MADDDRTGVSRRRFLQGAGAFGASALLGPIVKVFGAAADSEPSGRAQSAVPRRVFGNSGIAVPILALGGVVDFSTNQLLLHRAFDSGVRYWDTAHEYLGGRSEKGIGRYLARNPDHRKKLFLATKSGALTRWGLSRHLEASLERMNTDYVDLFMLHGINRMDRFTGNLRQWAQEAKAEGKIRLFGFSTHFNMQQCLATAARLGWVDGVMMSYNFRLLDSPSMQEAVVACKSAGIGLTAMKTMGLTQSTIGVDPGQGTGEGIPKIRHFLNSGLSVAQAKLKIVWESREISSICSQMPSMKILEENIAAAMDETHLRRIDADALKAYAWRTVGEYCAGCTATCESAVQGEAAVGDVMRALMYARQYGDSGRAMALLCRIPPARLRKMAALDYTRAESLCPCKIPIGRRVRESLQLFC